MITTRILPLWAVAQALLFTVEGLQVTMTRTPGSEYCGRLRCWNDADGTFTTTGVIVYDVTDPNAEIKIFSFYPNDDGIFIDQSKINDINGTGNISRYHVDLTLDFRNKTDCLHGIFQCEINFVNKSGQSDSLRETATINDASCSCETMMLEINKLSSRTDDVHRELTGLRLNNTLLEQELAHLMQTNTLLQINLNNLITQFSSLQSYFNFTHAVTTSTPPQQPATSVPIHTNCYRGMNHINAREKILLWGSIPALCDTESDSGGWILIQRRTMGDVDFYRGWNDYKNGFGTIDTDYWIGNDLIHNLTSHGYTEMRIDMGLYGLKYYAQFSQFHVTDEATNYQLTISGYDGNTGDSMSSGGIGITSSYVHDGMMFSTYDMDHDHSGDNCAQKNTGGWWYNNCYHANLNGVWARNDVGGIIWWNLNPYRSLTFVEMKVRHI